jgi:hypothetical protein
MSCNTYFALSPNTVQFGPDFEFHASEAGFEVHGYFAFDALFHFSPFWFITFRLPDRIAVHASVSLPKS